MLRNWPAQRGIATLSKPFPFNPPGETLVDFFTPMKRVCKAIGCFRFTKAEEDFCPQCKRKQMMTATLTDLVNQPHKEPDPLTVQVGGGHYKNQAIQPIEYCMMNQLDACQSAVIKYITRFRFKNGIEDLEKAKHYIDIPISFEKKRMG
jgi:hypothetical protein